MLGFERAQTNEIYFPESAVSIKNRPRNLPIAHGEEFVFMRGNARAAVLMRSFLLLHDYLKPSDTNLVFSASIRTRLCGAAHEDGIFVMNPVKMSCIGTAHGCFPGGRPTLLMRPKAEPANDSFRNRNMEKSEDRRIPQCSRETTVYCSFTANTPKLTAFETRVCSLGTFGRYFATLNSNSAKRRF